MAKTKRIIIAEAAMVAAAALMPNYVSATQVTTGSAAEVLSAGGDLVYVFKENGTFEVTQPGEVRFLVVGGGGGGGTISGYASGENAGGGGAGGVITNTVSLAAGTYSIAIGAGGAVGCNGGTTTVTRVSGNEVLFTALGGGAGAAKGGTGKTGASGGGSAATNGAGGGADNSFGNLGNNGGTSANATFPSGGGGAGAIGGSSKTDAQRYVYNISGGMGGDGIICDITGEDLYYGGGGASYRYNSFGATWSPGGKGGGGFAHSVYTVSGWSPETLPWGGYSGNRSRTLAYHGFANSGGGGCGSAAGGSGVVIIRFTPDSPLKPSQGFSIGGEANASKIIDNGDGTKDHVLVFSNASATATLTVKGNGFARILAVGGGGGGGRQGQVDADIPLHSGGGGGGGVVDKTLWLTNGTYQIAVGEGGGINTNGLNTTISPAGGAPMVTAYGGGSGANGSISGAMDSINKYPFFGASGGGSCAKDTTKILLFGGAPIYSHVNRGNYGGTSANVNYPGGGGGAGAPGGDGGIGENADKPGDGGDGYLCDITGEDAYYGGGGAGFHYVKGVHASGGKGGGGRLQNGFPYKGTDGTGGGGAGHRAGGSGIVIVRYTSVPNGTVIYMR